MKQYLRLCGVGAFVAASGVSRKIIPDIREAYEPFINCDKICPQPAPIAGFAPLASPSVSRRIARELLSSPPKVLGFPEKGHKIDKSEVPSIECRIASEKGLSC